MDGENKKSQAGTGTDWRVAVQQLIPIKIDRLDIHQGTLHFHNFTSEPNVHLVLKNLDGRFTNISNANRNKETVPAEFTLQGLMLENAPVKASGRLDPLGDFRDFVINMKITDIELPRINELTRVYGNFDIESGQGAFVMEVEAKDGKLTGYAKPLLDNVVVLDLEKDLEKGLFSAAWEAIVGGLGRIFRNQPKDRIASQIEIRGDLDQKNISAWQAFISVLRNAFVESYEAQFGRE